MAQVMKNIRSEIALLEAQKYHTELINLAKREARGERVSGKITKAYKNHKAAVAEADRLLGRAR